MNYRIFAIKYRPKSLADVAGHDATLQILSNSLGSNHLHHAYLFTGTRGVGKTTLARILAKCMNCLQGVSATPCGSCAACSGIDAGTFVDVIEVDAASKTKVEDTRALLENVSYTPAVGEFKIYIIDEIHMLSKHSFNALLKTLEEPPTNVKFFMATTEPEKLPKTILSRCLQFHLQNFSAQEIVNYLAEVLSKENIEYQTAALQQIAIFANGSIRDALSLLEQIVAFAGDNGITLETVQAISGMPVHQQLLELLDNIITAKVEQVLAIIADIAKQGVDFCQVVKELQIICYNISLAKIATHLVPEELAYDREQLLAIAAAVNLAQIQSYYQILTTGKQDLPYAPDMERGFVMLALRLLDAERVTATQVAAKPAIPEAMAAPPPSQPTTQQPRQNPAPQSGQKIVKAAAAPATPNNLQQIDWEQLLLKLQLPKVARQMAEYCEVKSWDGKVMQLVMEESHRKVFFSASRKNALETALGKHFNTKLILEIVAGTPQACVLGEEKAVQAAADQQKRYQQACDDPFVAKAQDFFDAVVEQVDDSVDKDV